MRIKNVWPAGNYVLYVKFEEGPVLKYDMSGLIEEDVRYYELKYFPERFGSAAPVNELRDLIWGDGPILDGGTIEREGKPVDVGTLELDSVEELDKLNEYRSETVVRKALESRYGNMLFLEGDDSEEFNSWLFDMSVAFLDKDYDDTPESLLFDGMGYTMFWP